MSGKHLGQHFLVDRVVLDKIVRAARLEADDLVVEIGPGTGELTRLLMERVRKVIAIEVDERLFERLKAQFAGRETVELVRGDAMDFPYESLPEFTVVANIPYYITTPLLFRLIASRERLKSLTLTIQKEVAERIVAPPGGKKYGVLSLMVQYYSVPTLLFPVSRRAFRPQPKVDSAVIRVEILRKPSVTVRDEKMFFRIIRTAFAQRRKMLSNALAPLRPDAKEWLRAAGIDPDRRAETVSIEEFARLSDSPGPA